MNEELNVLTVGIYVRLSEEDRYKSEEDESESIKNQKMMLIKYAKDHNWVIHDIYVDEDFTGADRNRPAFNQLLEDVRPPKGKRHGKIDIVLCKSQSRFTRELEYVEKYIHTLFPLWGVRFVSVVDNADTDNPGNKKARQINGLINEWYLEDLSNNIRKTFEVKKKEGQHIGAFALYGYMKDPKEKGHLIIDTDAAQVVKEVFQLYAQGMSKVNIARTLNARGIPNPTEYKRQKGLRYKGANSRNSTLWHYYTISDMLINEMYIGNMVQNRYSPISYKVHKNVPKPREEWIIVQNTHEPIIEKDLWESVQEQIKLKAKPFTDTGKIGIFSKKVKCMNCGYVLRSKKNHGKRYLQCPTRYTGGECEGAFVSVEKLQQIVLHELQSICKTYLDKDSAQAYIELRDKRNIKLQNAKKCHSELLAKKKKLEQNAENLFRQKIYETIDSEEYELLLGVFRQETAILNKSLAESNETITRLEKELEDDSYLENLLSKYLNVTELTREHVVTLIDYIEVGKRNPQTKELPVKIHWKF